MFSYSVNTEVKVGDTFTPRGASVKLIVVSLSKEFECTFTSEKTHNAVVGKKARFAKCKLA